MSKHRWPNRLLPIAAALSLLASCSKSEPPPPSRDEIFQERLELPALYFTAKTHRRVIAPARKGLFIDAQTGEVCWPALACHNPDCPGRKGDEPLLFIEPDAGVYAKPDGTIGYDQARAAAQRSVVAGCPECLKKRNLKAETPERRARYVSWVKPYVLPETAARLAELDELLQHRIALDRRQRVAVPFTEREPPPDGGPQPTPADPTTRPPR
jgi:hypothetical protein